jgi:hypothetical protein
VSEDLLWQDNDDDDDDDEDEYLAASVLGTGMPDVAVSARVWNYWLGGKDHCPADRRAGQAVASLYPGIGTLARSCRYFTARAVRYLAQAGIRQFLDIGTGMPFLDPVHEIAAPRSRVIYTDNDTDVMAHARALLGGTATVRTGHIRADLNDPGSLLDQARAGLDFTRPVAVLLMQVLGHIGDPARDDDRHARTIVGVLKDALSAGSYLAVSEITTADPAAAAAMARYSQDAAIPYHPRDPGQVARLFAGLRLIHPGVVPVWQWRPDPSPFTPPPVPAWGGIGATT